MIVIPLKNELTMILSHKYNNHQVKNSEEMREREAMCVCVGGGNNRLYHSLSIQKVKQISMVNIQKYTYLQKHQNNRHYSTTF